MIIVLNIIEVAQLIVISLFEQGNALFDTFQLRAMNGKWI